MMRAWGLGALDSLDKGESQTDDPRHPIRRTLTIVCVTRPDKILAPEEQFGFVPIDDGIYHCQERLEQWIIYPSELALVEKNYPLLPLARGKKLEQFISLCLHEGLKDYLQLIIDIGIATDPEVIWRKILEVKQMKPMIREDTWPIIDQFFRETPEAMVKISTIQEALADRMIRGEKKGALSHMQRTLIRQLRRKFSRLPDSIVLRIQKTDDIEQLDNWLDKIISVKSLAEAKQIFEIT
ncbi:hypothetical protein THIOM_000495 [Candidatus Thiomargarita nelsonii]|uniref:DUF4351 domain-containing protein n=1 Tax=Candidatus Thiomargarita nelsonii TaxID=1003181 RepID=A0A176S6Y6_9GAMM|nr:hypothetical protein THIOM_000495 [Candidatus Thiomargarita nelsonii]